MDEFRTKLFLEQAITASGVNLNRTFRGPQHEALAIIKKAYPQGCTVLDIGCGSGLFMMVLREQGFEVYGLDVAKPVVELLRGRGFPMWLGPVDSVPSGWVDPQVCTAFFMLHHLSAPAAFIRSVRQRFPTSLLIIGEADSLASGRLPSGFAREALPRTYTWWGKRQTQLALELGGYNASVISVLTLPQGNIMPRFISNLYKPLRARAPGLARWLVRFYYGLLPFWGWPGALWMRWCKRPNSILAVGHPSESVYPP